MSRRSRLRDESGVTVIELMVTAIVGLVVFLGLFNFLDITSSGSQQVAARIQANRLARPAMQRIVDLLHSTCVAPGIAPVLAGSSADSISFLHKTGSAVSPVPDKRTLTFNPTAGTLTDATYTPGSGTAPNWTWPATPTPNPPVQILKPVQREKVGSVETPVFRYFGFASNGTISTTPMVAPLDATEASQVVQVEVTFTVPSRTVQADPDGALTLSDTVTMRFSPPGETAASENLPCV